MHASVVLMCAGWLSLMIVMTTMMTMINISMMKIIMMKIVTIMIMMIMMMMITMMNQVCAFLRDHIYGLMQ